MTDDISRHVAELNGLETFNKNPRVGTHKDNTEFQAANKMEKLAPRQDMRAIPPSGKFSRFVSLFRGAGA